MSAKDAAFFYPRAHGLPSSTDQHLVYAFERPRSDEDPADTIRILFAQRYAQTPLLHRTVTRVRGDLSHPAIGRDPVFDPGRVLSRTVSTWADALVVLSDIVRVPLDPEQQMWQVHVLWGVADGPAGADTLVVVHASHALGAGFMLSLAIQSVLFDSDVPMPQLSPPDTDSPSRMARRGAARLPADLLRSARTAWRLRRTTNPSPDHERPPTPLLYNAQPSDQRVVRILTFDTQGEPLVVPRVLAAISEAMADHAEQNGDHDVRESLAAYLTLVLPPGVEWSSSNRFVSTSIPLYAHIRDTDELALSLRAAVSRARTVAFAPKNLARYELVEALPPVVVSRLVRRSVRRPGGGGAIGGHTVISTAVRAAPEPRGIGAAFRFSTGFPMLSPRIALTHSVAVIGDRVTIGLLTDPTVLPDIDGYCRRLTRAVPFSPSSTRERQG